MQILRAARFAHRRGIIHRDFKPQNVIVDDEGRAKVTDFGIARAGASDMTQTGSIMGTAQYLSPEQAQGHAVGARSDLYSIGIMLYELLTGRVPFDAESAVTIALKQVSEAPVPPSQLNPAVPPALEPSCCARCRRTRRTASPTPTSSSPRSSRPRIDPRRRRRPVTASMAAVARERPIPSAAPIAPRPRRRRRSSPTRAPERRADGRHRDGERRAARRRGCPDDGGDPWLWSRPSWSCCCSRAGRGRLMLTRPAAKVRVPTVRRPHRQRAAAVQNEGFDANIRARELRRRRATGRSGRTRSAARPSPSGLDRDAHACPTGPGACRTSRRSSA